MTDYSSSRRSRAPRAAAFAACCVVCSGIAFAQSPGTPASSPDAASQSTSASPPGDDDDAVLRPLEPDYTLIDLPTTLPLPAHKSDFHLLHRFNGNLRDGTFSNTISSGFGTDEGAIISLEYRYGLVKHVQVAISRTNFNRTIQFSGKYDAFHQSAARPVGFSAIVSVEGVNNFHSDYAPALGASISRGFFKAVKVFVDPVWVHNSAAATGVMRDTSFIGIGGHVRVLPALYLAAEVSPRVGGYVIGDAEYGFGIEGRVGGHTFALTFTNSQATTFGQLSRGGFPDSLYLGFNLSRKFF
jgi:hypothetical protein